MADAHLLLSRRLLEQQQAALDEVELLERQAPARRFQQLRVFWEMDVFEGRASRQQVMRCDDGSRQDLGQLELRIEQRAHGRAEEFLVQSVRRGVDRQDAEMLRPIYAVIEELVRMDLADRELAAPAIRKSRPSGHEDAAACLELRLEERLVEPCDLHVARTVADKRREDRHAAAAGTLLRDVRDRAGERRLLAWHEVGDRRLDRLVFIGARIVGQQVAETRDAELREQLRLLRPDALDGLDGIRELHRHASIARFASSARYMAVGRSAAGSTRNCGLWFAADLPVPTSTNAPGIVS